jgi:hypothetical protein
MKLTEIIKKIQLVERYRLVCLEFTNEDYTKSRPQRENVLSILSNIGYDAKYIARDRLYIAKFYAGVYSFEYYFEIDGCACDILLYIKKTPTDWPLERAGFTGFLLSSGLYPPTRKDQVVGYMLFTPSLPELEAALEKMKPILDDLKNEILPYLINDEIEFDIK